MLYQHLVCLDAFLLKRVSAFQGPKNIQANVFFTASKEVLYYTSAVGILYNAEHNTQRFYIGHEVGLTL